MLFCGSPSSERQTLWTYSEMDLWGSRPLALASSDSNRGISNRFTAYLFSRQHSGMKAGIPHCQSARPDLCESESLIHARSKAKDQGSKIKDENLSSRPGRTSQQAI